MNLFWRTPSHVQTARETLDAMAPFAFRFALEMVMEGEMWRGASADAQKEFAAFAVSPTGLAANNQEKAQLLIDELLRSGRFRQAAEFLDHVARAPGRQANNDSNGVSIRFFVIKKGLHTRTNMTLWLFRNNISLFEKVCNRELSLRSACIQAGHIKVDHNFLRNGVLRGFPTWTPAEQAHFMTTLWRGASASFQIGFIETQIDPALPPTVRIADLWRKVHDTGYKR